MIGGSLELLETEGKLTVCVSSIRGDTKSRWLLSGKTGEIRFPSVIRNGKLERNSMALRGRLEGRAVAR